MSTIGAVKVEDTADSPHIRKTGTKWTVTRTQTGPYADLDALAAALKDSNTVTGDATMVYTSVELRRTEGDQGVLVTVMETLSPEIYEITWQPVSKPIMTNPRIGVATIGTDGKPVYDTDRLAHLERWKEAPLKRRIAYQYSPKDNPDPDNDADWEPLEEDTEKKLAVKILAGCHEYLVFCPVVSRTSWSLEKPPTGGCGKISDPPAEVKVSGYAYMKNDDRAQKQGDGIWVRTESWQGADSWDGDLYESDTAASSGGGHEGGE